MKRSLRFWRSNVRADVDDEMAFHLHSAIDEYVALGMSYQQASDKARERFGDVAAIKRTLHTLGQRQERRVHRREWIQSVGDDIRFAMRQLKRSVGFAAIAVLSLGVGIGATTTVFSVIDAFDFRPLPFKDAQRLMWIAETTPDGHEICSHCPFNTSLSTLSDWNSRARSFDVIAAFTAREFSWQHDDVREYQARSEVTPSFFTLLGVQPQLGRSFLPSDTAAGAERTALVSHAFWQSRLGASPNVIGTQLRTAEDADANAGPVTIIGVLPESFHFRGEASIWTPLRVDANAARASRTIFAVGHIAAGYTRSSAKAELSAITSALASDNPDAYKGWGIGVLPLRDLLTIGAAPNRFTLFAITALVLFVATLNVTGLLATRAYARQSEFAVRSALGAGRLRLLRQLVVEGLCIGIAGGAIGVLLSVAAIGFVPKWFGLEDNGLALSIDQRLLAFATVLSVLVGASSAIAPALRAAGTELGSALRARSTQFTTRGARTAGALLATQIGVALILLTAAAVLSRDYLAVRYFDIGYNPDKLYYGSIPATPATKGNSKAWRVLAETVRDRVGALPGVAFVTLEHRSAVHPTIVRADSAQPSQDQASQQSTPQLVKAVSVEYFRTFGTVLSSGRDFSVADRRGTPAVAIVNESAAARLWPSRSPLGRQVFVGDSGSGEWLTVVGVAGDAERGELVGRRHVPMIYRPFAQAPVYHAGGSIHVRLSNANAATLSAVQSAMRQEIGQYADPLKSANERVNEKFMQRQLNAIAVNAFALFGLLLAAMGIYGSVAYAAKQRTQEIGIRVALGATRSDVVTTLSRRGLQIAVSGVVVGTFGAFALTRVLQSMVIATAAASAALLVAVGLVMISTVVVATLVPALQATRIDPVSALRGE